MRFGLLGAATLLLSHTALSGESYVLKHESSEGSWYFDMGSIVIVDETTRRSQMSLNLTNPLQDQPTGRQYDRLVFFYEHDCKRNRMRVTDTVPYLKGERVTMTPPSPEWRPADESVAQKYACALMDKGGGR